MALKFSVNHFAYASLVCSLLFWLGLILSYAPVAPRLINSIPGGWWLVIEGAGIALAAVAAVLQSKLWRLAVPLALGTFFFIWYVIGS
jgi:hypothetical protein